MEKKLPIYELLVEDDWAMGDISYIDNPANTKPFFAFNKQKVQLSSVVEDKQEVIGVVLIPDQLIIRQDQTGYEYQVFFSEETIAELSRQYIANMWGNAGTTLQHDLPVKDTQLLESWFTGETDKAKGLGFDDLPKGTWMVHFKVNSPTVWAEIKAGMANGFSVETWMNIIPTELSKQTPKVEDEVIEPEVDLTDEEVIAEIKSLFDTNK